MAEQISVEAAGFEIERHGGVRDDQAVEPGRSGTIRAGKLAGKSMWTAIWILSWPVLLQQLMTAGVGLVDKILAGSLPRDIIVPAIDAIGIGSYVGWLIGIAMAGLGIGGQVLIARGMGSGDLSQSGRALGQALALSVLWGALVGAAMWVTAEPLGRMCGLSDDAIIYCVQYVHMLAYSMPFTGILMVGSMCMHGAGETTMPSVIAALVNVINIICSWMLSGVDIQFGQWGELINPFTFDLNVLGIAAGTAIAYVFGALLTLIVLIRGIKDLRLQKHHLHPDRSMSRRIVYLGVPNFLEGLAMWGVNLFVLIFIGWIALEGGGNGGGGLQGAHIIAVQWEALSFLPGFAMGTAAGALAGQYLGAGNPAMAQRAIIACAAVASIIMGLCGVAFMLWGGPLTSIISSEPVHMEQVPRILFIAGLIQIPFAITMVVRQGLRGAGDAMWTFVITTVSSYAVRLPAAWLLGVHFGLGLEGIWIALCGELVVRAALFTTRFLHGGWKKLKV